MPPLPTIAFRSPRQYTLQSSSVSPALLISQTPPIPTDNTGYNLTHQYDLPNAKVPSFQQINFDVQRELPGHVLVSAGYTSSNGRHLMRNVQYNQIPHWSGTSCWQRHAGDASLPNFANIGYFCECQSSSYNALLVNVERRFANGFMMRAAFTWSKFIDEQNDNFSGLFPQDQYNQRAERGLSLSNIPTRLVVSGLYTLPFGHGQRFVNNGVMATLIGGWEVEVSSRCNQGSRSGCARRTTRRGPSSQMQRPNIVADPFLGDSQRTLTSYFNTAAFAAPAPLTFGNSRKTAEHSGTGVVQPGCKSPSRYSSAHHGNDAPGAARRVLQLREPRELPSSRWPARDRPPSDRLPPRRRRYAAGRW